MTFIVERLRQNSRFYVNALLLILGLQVALYARDPQVHFYLGDSLSYIATAQADYAAGDRSYLYGPWFISLANQAVDLAALVMEQVVMFVAASWLTLFLACEYLQAPRRRALIVILIATLVPLHMIWTRYVLTETAGLFFLTLYLAFAFEYVRSAGAWWLVPLTLAGTAALAMRIVMTAPILAASFALPLLVAALQWRAFGIDAVARKKVLWRGAGHLLLSLMCVWVVHGAYRAEFAARMTATKSADPPLAPAYSYSTGAFLLGFYGPLVQPEHFPPELDGKALLAAVADSIRDPYMRLHHRHQPTGLVKRFIAAVTAVDGTDRRADAMMKQTALAAMAADPGGVLRLAWLNQTGYWDENRFASMQLEELGIGRPLVPEARANLRDWYRLAVGEDPNHRSLLQRAYLKLQIYPAVISVLWWLAPVVFLIQRRRVWAYYAILTGFVLYFGAASLLLSSCSTGRFLQPISWLLWMGAAGVRWRRRTV